jgi:hypothetical protein
MRVGGVAVEGLQVAANAGGVHAQGATVGVPVADEVEDVAAGGGVPGFAHEPVGGAVVGIVAVALRDVTPVRGKQIAQDRIAYVPRDSLLHLVKAHSAESFS